MPLELYKVPELRIWADTALDRLDYPAREVCLRSLEEYPMPWLEYTGDLEKLCRSLWLLLRRALGMERRILINTPLDPSRLPIRRLYRPPLLEARSRQGSVVNALRTRGREPLRSASRLLGFTTGLCMRDPSRRLVAGPSRGLRCVWDPLSFCTAGSFPGWHLETLRPYRDSIALRWPYLMAAFQEGRSRCVCRRRI